MRKYKTEEERKTARRLQNRLAKQRQRANIKLNKKQYTAIPPQPVNVAQSYRNDLFNECVRFPFSHSITLTNNKQVTLNMNNKAVEELIDFLVSNNYITNYIKTNEYTGNYHSHILVQAAFWNIDFREILLKRWSGDGFFKVVPIYTERHRINAVKYVFKQIDITSNSALKQSLADTWSILLPQSFESLKKANIALLEQFKISNGIQTLAKHILKENGGSK